ncbi:uncharacterized protein HMPREF1120_05540 [Exophiala dermatitidis NIH/UT8656]|uniref:Uncharacterized protein n=1 Tax=Exophiala dermatitidis (strain ATCC 34100 / CBS 525.76 / NIH/UT8656) TaxID=858893 RepID=H6BY72_EXODN|nr:uncharacterized protein HMPREF1120_05540 [Exophiala dermatitidis NIH/UT8656]EHY57508.1 hypothetical protein HMPREF1120_05540 [Exophiala dermatitidis NIH/UT8656]
MLTTGMLTTGLHRSHVHNQDHAHNHPRPPPTPPTPRLLQLATTTSQQLTTQPLLLLILLLLLTTRYEKPTTLDALALALQVQHNRLHAARHLPPYTLCWHCWTICWPPTAHCPPPLAHWNPGSLFLDLSFHIMLHRPLPAAHGAPLSTSPRSYDPSMPQVASQRSTRGPTKTHGGRILTANHSRGGLGAFSHNTTHQNASLHGYC